MSKLSPARAAALKIGSIVRLRKAYTAEVATTVLGQATDLTPEDRAFARKLALGVTACFGTLDYVIDHCLRSPSDIQDDVRDALRISAYELIFLDKQDHAAVDQGVELVRSVAPKASGLANAVLRKIARASQSFPFGNPATDTQALARSVAFPLWLAKRLIDGLGRDDAWAFMRECNSDAPVFIAANDCWKSPGTDVIDLPAIDGLEALGDLPGAYRLTRPGALTGGPLAFALKTGQAIVTDEAAQRIAAFALPEQCPQAFLEVGAGRGTKTILLQNHAMRRFGSQMPLISVDDHQFKVDLLKRRTSAFGIRLDEALVADATKFASGFDGRMFDAVFIDAPCSGLGTLRRHPEIRWRITPKDIEVLSKIGLAMLIECSKHVVCGGTIVFATCTVLPEENELTIQRFLKSRFGESFDVVDTLKTDLTHDGCDAHYAVKLRRVR